MSCTDKAGERFFVEILVHWSLYYRFHFVFEASKIYAVRDEQIVKYESVQPVYSLNFFVKETINHLCQNDYYFHYKTVYSKNTGKQIRGIEAVCIELSKFEQQNRLTDTRDLWMLFLSATGEWMENAPPELMENIITREALKCAEKYSYTNEQLHEYDQCKINILTERAIVDDLTG